MRRLLLHLWSLRKEITKYGIIGGSSFILDTGSLKLLTELAQIHPVMAVVMNQPPIIIYGFFLNKHWTFREKSIPHWQLIRYTILAIWNYTFSILSMHVLHTLLGVEELFARILSIAMMVSWNFFLYKYWVYRPSLIHSLHTDGS